MCEHFCYKMVQCGTFVWCIVVLVKWVHYSLRHRINVPPFKIQDSIHDDVIKWRHFPRYWPFVRRIHRSPVNSPHKGQWRGALMFTLICARIKGWVNNCEAGDLRRNRAHYDVIVMHRLFRGNTDIHIYITVMDTWRNMFLNGNMI